jgi:hypothetical protein
MSGLGKRARAALEAVAGHFSATWEKGEAPPDAYLTIARKRIAVEVTTTKQRIARPRRSHNASLAVRSGCAQVCSPFAGRAERVRAG